MLRNLDDCPNAPFLLGDVKIPIDFGNQREIRKPYAEFITLSERLFL